MIDQHQKNGKSFCVGIFSFFQSKKTEHKRNVDMSDTYDTKNTGNQKDTNDFFQPNGIDTIHIRLEELRDGLSYKDFGLKVSISESGVRKYFPPYLSMPSIDKAVSIADACGVNLDWLATGKGPKFRDGTNEESECKCVQKDDFDEEYALIPGYHIQVSAGPGTALNGETIKRRLAFRRKWLKYRGLDETRLAVVFAKGDSMEPTIQSGDSILIDTRRTQIEDGSIFVLRLGDDLYAKRLQKNYDGSITIISDNKADYQPQVVPADQLFNLAVIGKVVWVGHDIH